MKSKSVCGLRLDQMWTNTGLRPNEYAAPVLGLLFLRYAEKRIADTQSQLRANASVVELLRLNYGVETKIRNKAVKRNLQRLPLDFMFQLTQDEAESLRFQIGTSKRGRGGRRYLPYVFTEQGVAMLSSVLNSERAISVHIEIMRAFVKLRQCSCQVRNLLVAWTNLKASTINNSKLYLSRFAT